ncbi:MAG: T9SS type B sorting domain-containing protein [Cyclobacteriaceae bacterium]|nr:T9SS type B sorting domain-containing protein [Cyclobacteriaceae bacterium]
MVRYRFLLCLLLISTLITQNSRAQSACGCTHIISLNAAEYQFDGAAKGVKPGDKICFTSGTRTGIGLFNIKGTKENPVIITNMCDGKVTINAPLAWGNAVSIENSSHFKFTGSANPNEEFGIEIKGGQMGLNMQKFSTNFEVDHINVNNVGCCGMVAKTDPTCDPATWRANFILKDAIFHHNRIWNTGCEGFYIGNSHYDGGKSLTCSGQNIIVDEHDIDNVQIYNNDLQNIGNDGIQVGSSKNTVIHHNYVYNVGTKNNAGHLNSIQAGGGTQAIVYNNLVDTGKGYGLYDTGGGGIYFNNIVTNIQLGGMLLQDTPPNYAPTGFRIFNNTFINCKDFGVLMFSEHPDASLFSNNIMVGQNQSNYVYFNLNNPSKNKWTETNNIKTQDINTVKFVNPAAKDFRLQSTSPAVNAGKDVSSFGITYDYDHQPRPSGSIFDIGAYELQTGGPTSNAGADKTITLPTNNLTLNGSGTSPTGITGYLWSKKSGGTATLSNETTANLTLTNLVQGVYVFELKVTDASGFALDEVTVNVLPQAANQNPIANAGPDKTITLPTNSLVLNGIGTDADGSITSYAWTKLSGPTVTLTNQSTANLSLSNLLQGTYVFQLTVTDNNGATGSDQVTVVVNPVATNQLPIVNAGTQKTIFLPTNQVSITATASDPDGTISSIVWEKRSGGPATLTNANSLTVTVSGLTAGIYTFRITVTDNGGATAFSEVNVNVLQGNQSPTANAGNDQAITLPTNSINLVGTGIDPDGSIVGYSWTKVSGPAANLTNTNTPILVVTNMVQGTYIFSLTVTDNEGSTGSDQVTVTVSVSSSGTNEAPIAIAGGNISFSLPTNSVNLYGSGFDPDGSITTYSWVKASGGTATLVNADKPTLTVTNLQAGQYIFRLTVTDNSGISDDDIAIVTVSASGTNIFPVASAGADKIVKLPLTSVSLIGSGSDEDGQIVSYQWSLQSGANVNIGTPTLPSTNVTGLALGEYKFRLTVTDNSGATDFNDVLVRVVASTTNQPPSITVPTSVKIFEPQNTLNIEGSATDDGQITDYTWAKLGGPAATLVNANQPTITIQNLVVGEYTFKLTVTDNNDASVFAIVKVYVLPATSAPPVADAGSDQEITLPLNSINLTGSATTTNGTITTTTWTKVLGPAASLSGANTTTLSITNMVAGTYLLKFTVRNSLGQEASDNVQVIVHPIPPNQVPIVNAGTNTTITLPISQVTLTGSATDADGTVVSTSWTQINGPSNAIFQNATALTSIATNLIEGAYTFRLSATDNQGGVGSNYVIIYVAPPLNSGNLPPVVYAGDDVTLTLPTNSTTIFGNAYDPDGSAVTALNWEQIDGQPAQINISNGNILELSNLALGTYTFRFSATDDDQLTSSDDVTVFVIEKTQEIPKFFTPNNDGRGEVWVIRNIDTYQTCGLVVFSRSGQTVYKAKPYQNNWDGTMNGKPLSDGDYYYSFNCDDGRTVKGAVRIIR